MTITMDRYYRSNAILSVIEGMFVMIMVGMTAPFLGVYLLKLGGSDLEIAWLSAIPPIVTAVAVFPATKVLAAQNGRYLRLIIITAALSRSFYLLFGLIPFFIPTTFRAPSLILLFGAATIPGTFLNLAWTAMIGKLIPPTRRGTFFGWRNTLTVGISVIATMVGGWMLDACSYPWSFFWLFMLSFIVLMISTVLVSFTVEYDAEQGPQVESLPAAGLSEPPETCSYQVKDLKIFYAATFLVHLGLNMIGPLLTIYHVRHLGLSNLEIGALTTAGTLASVGTFILWGKIADRYGNRRTLLWAIGGVSLFTFGYLLHQSFYYLLAMNLLNGVFLAGFGQVLFNLLLEISPPRERINTMAFFNLSVNISSFLAPLLGTMLAGKNFLWLTFLLAGLIRVGAMFLFREIGRPLPRWWIHYGRPILLSTRNLLPLHRK